MGEYDGGRGLRWETMMGATAGNYDVGGGGWVAKMGEAAMMAECDGGGGYDSELHLVLLWRAMLRCITGDYERGQGALRSYYDGAAVVVAMFRVMI
jgi:hypothetical protein